MIITIDGPAGSGKSSAARALAQRLGFDYLDTGAMYRAVALASLRAGVAPDDLTGLERLLRHLRLEIGPGRVILDGEDVSSLIRAPDVTARASELAVIGLVRRYLAEQQRALGQGRNLVCEGRDQGTVVFPDAACKFFLQADPTERARRRQRELAQRGKTLSLEEVLQAQNERDRRDAERDLAPMMPAADAVVIDTTHLTLEEVVDRLVQEVAARTGAKGPAQDSGARA
ncbi:MAG: (d)CMP kinase [Gemmataceae bacterium]|nr:(d)CMP kinase [Gemmataceae bacterium]MDW8265840.1 (d)CMP kinase [Gemmataceae bacterium]